jgi:hypothetical protein
MDEGGDRFGVDELFADGGQSGEKSVPGGGAFGEREFFGEVILSGDTGAREAVGKAEDPDPASVEDVVESGRVGRIGRTIGLRPGGDVGEVGVERLRLEAGEGGLGEGERFVEEAARARGVDEKAGADRRGGTGDG